VPVHQQLREWLTDELERFAPDEKLPTEFEIAGRFQVSRLTVHKVMAELQRTGFVIRKPGRGTFVASRDKRIHTANEVGRNGRVLIAYADWFSYDIWAKVDSAERLALSHGIELLNFKITRETMFQSLDRLLASQIALRGVLIVPPGGAVDDETLARLDSLGVPVVLLIPRSPVAQSKHLYSVSQDFHRIGYLTIATLVAAGHRTIGFVASEPWHDGSSQVYAGMKQALYDHDLLLRNLRRPTRHTHAWEDANSRAYTLTTQMLRQPDPPTAFVYDSVPNALAGVRALHEIAPERVATTGIVINADYFGVDAYLWPPPTIITCDLQAIVAKAFSLLLGEGDLASHVHVVEPHVMHPTPQLSAD